VELAPQYPENRLNLIEAYLNGANPTGPARTAALEEAWPCARTNFVGEAWAASWADWEPRLKKLKKKIEAPPKPRARRPAARETLTFAGSGRHHRNPIRWAEFGFELLASARRVQPRTTAKVVEPLPDISVAAAPLARRNSWNNASSGYFSSAGASSEL
jgi:hypothetical protein